MGFVDICGSEVQLEHCWWYHCLDFPDGSSVTGDWDLRNRFTEYTGNVSLADKRVLDVGTASGFLAFNAERAGANVVSFDMPANGNWDMVPFADESIGALSTSEIEARLKLRRQSEATRYKRESAIDSMRKGYFYAHHKYSSRARLFEGNIYEIDDRVGIFDVAFMGAILLHLRDPFLALHRVAQITARQLVISDLCESGFRNDCGAKPLLEFPPDEAKVHTHAWWRLSPRALEEMLRVVGFRISSETLASFKFKGNDLEYVTIVADRTSV